MWAPEGWAIIWELNLTEKYPLTSECVPNLFILYSLLTVSLTMSSLHLIQGSLSLEEKWLEWCVFGTFSNFITMKAYVITAGRNGGVGEGSVGDYEHFLALTRDLNYFNFKTAWILTRWIQANHEEKSHFCLIHQVSRTTPSTQWAPSGWLSNDSMTGLMDDIMNY